MRARDSLAGNGKRIASTLESDGARTRVGSLLFFSAAFVLGGCGGGPASVLEPSSFIAGVRPASGAATHEPVTGDKDAGAHAFLRDLYQDGPECREPDPPTSCPPLRIGIEDIPVAFTHPAFHGRVVLDERLSDLTLVGFDAMDFPFRFPPGNFVHDTVEPDPEVPEFLTGGAGDTACHSLLHPAPGLVCAPSAPGGSLYALAGPDGAGAWWRFSNNVSLSAFTRRRGGLDGAASGAFSFEGVSSLAALRLDREWPLDETGRWKMAGTFILAADLPRGIGERRTSLLEIGPALLSDWTIGLTHSDSRNLHTRLSLSQPPRAETGHGVLTLPNGRREDGTRTYETHRFSLVPSRRQLTLRLAHQRPFAGGDVVVSVHRTKNRGHSHGPSHVVAGIAWRMSF